jgi:energy-coupling factor transporter ATP-binding protein EcfA2
MTTIAELREALDAVPFALLDKDDRRVMTETITSLDALDRFDVVPTVVTFVGSSGSGKSSLVNAAMGSDVAPSGPVRPTTDKVLMIGSTGPVSLSAQSEYLHVPSIRPGLLVIDTPPWEHDPSGVRSAVQVADLVVVVVTPSRYADASVSELVESIPTKRPAAVVLNRVDVSEADRPVLLSSVGERFNVDLIIIDEHEPMEPAAAELVNRLNIDSIEYQRSAVLRSAAASGSRYLAKRLTEEAPRLADLERAVERAPVVPPNPSVFAVYDEWGPTREGLVDHVTQTVSELDDRITSASGDLGERVHNGLGDPDLSELESRFDAWRETLILDFITHASVRWRQKSAYDQIESFSWRLSINSNVQVPTRMRRVMGDRLDGCASEANADLVGVFNGALSTRLAEWKDAVDTLGSYTPGVLLGASEAFGPARNTDG